MADKENTGDEGSIFRKIDEVNSLMEKLESNNDSIDKVTNTIVISNGEIVDTVNLSVMSLPSNRDFYRNI